MSEYRYGDKVMSAGEIRAASPEIQQEVMREWFYNNFEDPINETPRVDGEYWFIYGGPHEPNDVLHDEFMDIVSEDVIFALADEIIHSGGIEWAPTSSGIYGVQGFTDDPYRNFVEGLDNIESLLSVRIRNIHGKARKLFNMLLYVSAITALEVYLSDTLRQQMEEKDALARRFVETNRIFKERKIPMSDIYKTMGGIKKIINDYLSKIVWHRLKEVEAMYKATLRITFPENKAAILRAIKIRHNILHNGGCFENEEDNNAVTLDGVKKLIGEVRVFVSDIEQRIRQVNKHSNIIANEPPEDSPF